MADDKQTDKMLSNALTCFSLIILGLAVGAAAKASGKSIGESVAWGVGAVCVLFVCVCLVVCVFSAGSTIQTMQNNQKN